MVAKNLKSIRQNLKSTFYSDFYRNFLNGNKKEKDQSDCRTR